MKNTAEAAITVLTENRRGVVASLCRYLRQHRHVVGITRMTILQALGARMGSVFETGLLIRGEREDIERVIQTIERDLDGLGARVIRAVFDGEDEERFSLDVRVECVDEEGVVARISDRLEDIADIESLSAMVESAPITGTPIFRMDLLVSSTSRLDREEVVNRLRELEEKERWDIFWKRGSEPIHVDSAEKGVVKDVRVAGPELV